MARSIWLAPISPSSPIRRHRSILLAFAAGALGVRPDPGSSLSGSSSARLVWQGHPDAVDGLRYAIILIFDDLVKIIAGPKCKMMGMPDVFAGFRRLNSPAASFRPYYAS